MIMRGKEMGNMKTIFIFKWNCKNGFVFVEMHPNLNVQRPGNKQGHVRDMEYYIPHTTIFHFIKFYRRCERIFCKWFCFVTLSKLCSYKNTFSFFPFFELAAERKLCYGGGDEENFK